MSSSGGQTPKKRTHPLTISGSITRFEVDPKHTNLDLGTSKILFEKDVEFPRIDDRFAMMKHIKTFTCLMTLRLVPTSCTSCALWAAASHPITPLQSWTSLEDSL